MIKNSYSKLRSFLPSSFQIKLSKAVFSILRKPIFINSENFSAMTKGTIIISADFELAWAWRYSKRKVDPIKMAQRERENFSFILNKLNELEIPVTWATVGHLFLDSCVRKNGTPHFEMLRPKYFENEFWKYDKGDWFDFDPCGNYRTHSEFYAPDLIEMILNSNVKHEIGCHSFSHIDYSEKNSNAEVVECDLNACKEAVKKFGIELKSFVFPGNFYGHFDLLKKFNYKVIRYKSNELKEIGHPEKIDNGLIAIHDSMAFDIAEEGWDSNYIFWKLKKYVEKAIDKKAIAHFWFHPSIKKVDIYNYFFPFLDYLNKKRDKGIIDIITMNNIKN